MINRERRSNLSEQDGILLEIESALSRRGWQKKICLENDCGRVFFSKSKTAQNCSRYECTGYAFLERKTKKTLVPTRSISNAASQLFSENGLQAVEALPVINKKGSTLFTGTCGQYFDDTIFYGRQTEQKSVFLAQPAIRLQGEDLVGQIDGFSTSFVNIATEHLNAQLADHLKNLELWMDFLSSQGLFMGDISLSIKYDNPQWGARVSPQAVSLKINYLGLEIGIANFFFDIRTPGQNHSMTMSDIGFGLERLAWAINKTPSYFDIIGPLDFSLKGSSTHSYIDKYRTATLMAASGVVPSNKDRGSKLRKMVKDFSSSDLRLSHELVRYYYQWWSQFSIQPLSQQQTLDLLSKESRRNVNMETSEIVKASHKNLSAEIDPDAYMRFLLEQGLVTFDQLRRLFNEGSQDEKNR